MKKEKLLLFEEDFIIAIFVVDIFESLGYSTFHVTSSNDLLKSISSEDFDLLILGTASKSIKFYLQVLYNFNELSSIPVIFFSSLKSKNYLDQMKKYNVLGIIEKPASREVFIEKFTYLINLKNKVNKI